MSTRIHQTPPPPQLPASAPEKHDAGLFDRIAESQTIATIATIATLGGLSLGIGATNSEARGKPDIPVTPTGVTNYDITELSGDKGGAWSFFGDPRAVKYKNDIYTGWVNRKGYVQIAQYDLETNEKKVKTLTPNLGRPDDHNNPSLHVRKDGRITAYYSPHSGRQLPLKGVSRMYYRTTKRPGDISDWGKAHYLKTNTKGKLGYTYPNPVDIGGDKTFLSWRGGNWTPTASINHGETKWSKARSILRSSAHKRPYAKFASGPDNSVLVAYNQDNPGMTSTDLYYLRYKPGKGYYRANGKKVNRPNKVATSFKGDKVASRAKYGRTWVMDVAADQKGRPTILFSGARGNQSSFYYTRWNGKKWDTEKITDSGFSNGSKSPRNYGNYITAGGTLDHSDPSKVYLSRAAINKPDINRKRMQVEKWELNSRDNVHSGWKSERISPEGMECVRPATIRGDLLGNIVMMCGRYRNWLDFQTSIFLARPKNPVEQTASVPSPIHEEPVTLTPPAPVTPEPAEEPTPAETTSEIPPTPEAGSPPN